MRPLPKGVVLKLRSKTIQPGRRCPGPSLADYTDEDLEEAWRAGDLVEDKSFAGLAIGSLIPGVLREEYK
jgi:hypothetical protein